MAIEKALFTSQEDFKQEGSAFNVVPFLQYKDDEPNPNFTNVGTIRKVPGVYRNASDFALGFAWAGAGPTTKTRHVVSLFYKPTTADLSSWRILFTNRGWGSANYGLHLALYNGALNARIYGTGGTIDLYSDDVANFFLTADKVHHIVFKYDEADTFPLEVYVDGARVIFSGVKTANVNGIARRFNIGDIPTAGGGSTYTLNGWIDELHYFAGNTPDMTWLMTEYPNILKSGNWIDWWTVPGSMVLGKNDQGLYTTEVQEWVSPTIDLGADGFDDFGRVQMNFLRPSGTAINVFTRSSLNGTDWNSWIKIQDNGRINSPDNPYMQIMVQMFTVDPSLTPTVQEIQVLDYERIRRLSLVNEPLILYRDLASGLERVGELINAYDIYLTEEVNGEETLEFKMALNDQKRIDLGAEPVELIAQVGDKRFIVKNPVDKRDDRGRKYSEFSCEALWYELRDAKVIEFESVEQTAFDTMQQILDSSIVPTGWTIYKSDISIKRTIRGQWKSVLELLHEVRDIFGGELVFDTINKTISLVIRVGEDNGVRFYYNKNLKTIVRSVDTYDLVTRLYVYGKNDLSIRSVNNNVEYLENTTWVDALNLRNRIRIGRWSDGRYTIPQNLKDDGTLMLNEMAKPNVRYDMSVLDLSALSGHEHESVGLGDTVVTIDTELLDLLVENRIMRMKRNLRDPRDTEIELAQPKKELADANKRAIDDAIEVLSETDPLDTSDVQQMTVFNHLLNSRAEDGKAYWAETGTGFETVLGGFSGDSAWQVTGGYGTENILKQSIYGVSHRSAYTVSAYVATEGEITRGPTDDAFVGIRVRIHYTEPDTDGKTFEDHYLSIPDLTQEGGEEVV